MRDNFLKLPFEERFCIIQQVKSEIRSSLESLGTDVSVATFGSSTYGYNNRVRGNMDDLDAFMVIRSILPYLDFVKVVQIVIPGSSLIQEEDYQKLQSSDYGILRFYGQIRGVKISFRVITVERLARLVSNDGCVDSVANITRGEVSRIIEDVEQRIGGGDPRSCMLATEYVASDANKEKVLAVYQHVISSDRQYLGSLGRKLLTCEPLYDPNNSVKNSLGRLWQLYIKMSLTANPKVTVNQIIDLIMRSERFSDEFRQMLVDRVNSYHCLG